MLLAQLTDCHVVEPGRLLSDRVDTAAMLQAAVAHVNGLSPRPEVVLATGDLVNDGLPGQYIRLGEILSELTMTVLPIPGNHDDRTGLRATFAELAAGGPDDRIDYVVDRWPLRLVALDTTIPGEHGGQVTPDQMSWLDAVLAEAPDVPTLVFQHHPPFLTGIEWMDQTRLAQRGLEHEVIGRHEQVQAIVCGHIHRVVQSRVGGATASTWPSTGAQVALALDGTPYGYIDEPPAVALHQWTPSEGLVSHISYVGGPTPWVPAWAAEALGES